MSVAAGCAGETLRGLRATTKHALRVGEPKDKIEA